MDAADIRWPATIAEAKRFYERYKVLLRLAPLRKDPEYVAGADAAFAGQRVFAAVSLYHYPDLTFVEQAISVREADFPYIPGYLFFREGRAVMAAVKKMTILPDVVLVDGHGIAHPAGIGSASLLGILLGISTIGCAKTRLIGEYTGPEMRRGSTSPLTYKGINIGAVVRTQDGIRPLFVSPGHEIDLEGSIRVVLACVDKYRIPEPLRQADRVSKKLRMTW